MQEVRSITNHFFEGFIPMEDNSNRLIAWIGKRYIQQGEEPWVYFYPSDGNYYTEPGFYVINIANPSAPAVIGTYKDSSMRSIYFNGETGYALCRVANGDKQSVYAEEWILKVLSIHAGTITEVTSIPMPGLTTNMYGKAVTKTYDQESTDWYYYPETYQCMQTKGKYNTSMFFSFNQPMGIKGNTLYIGIPGDGILIFDISIPTEPVLLNVLKHEYQIKKMEVVDNLLVLLDHEGVKLIDITSTQDPKLLSYFKVSWMEDIAVHDSALYVSGPWAGLVKLDISSPSSITELGTAPIDQINSIISVDQTGVWCASGKKGVINLNGFMQ
jgi:hypothetical protein